MSRRKSAFGRSSAFPGSDRPPVSETAGRTKQERLVLIACILASSLVGMDSLMTTVALPAIASDLGAGLAVQQWIVAAFLLALGSLILVGGALGDVYSRRSVFGGGIAGFGVASLLCAFAPNVPVLISGRLVQGAAAALLLPSVLAILSATFKGAKRSRAIASWSAWSGLSVIAGPVVAGLLINAVSWRAIYWVEAPCAILVLWLVLRTTVPDTSMSRGSVDVGGAVLAAPSVGGAAFYLIQAPRTGWTHPLTLGMLVIGVASLITFVIWERRAPNPLLPLDLFRTREFTVLNVVTFVLYGALIACGTYTVLFLQDTAGYAPAVAGAAAAVPIMVLFVLSNRFGALADKHGGRLFVGGGSVIAGAGMLLLLGADGRGDLWPVVVPSVLVHGLGLSMLVAPLTSGVMSAAPDDRAGVASGINNAVARTGSMIGIAVVGAIISFQFSARTDTALQGEDLSAGVLSVLQQARERPLGATVVGELTGEEYQVVAPVLADASIGAFRGGVIVMGGLAMLAGAMALVGLREPARRKYDAAGTIGCPVTGVRTHPDAPPVGARSA